LTLQRQINHYPIKTTRSPEFSPRPHILRDEG